MGGATTSSSKAQQRLAARRQGQQAQGRSSASPEETPYAYGADVEAGAGSRERLAARRDKQRRQQEEDATSVSASGRPSEAGPSDQPSDGWGGDTGVWG